MSLASPEAPPQSVIDRYDIGDVPQSAKQSPPASQEPVVSAEPPAPARATPERDPATGKFVKAAGLSPFLLAQAKQLGIPETELANFDPEDLREIIRDARADRRHQIQLEALSQGRHPPTADNPQNVVPVEPEPKPAVADPTESDYDPGLIAYINRLMKVRDDRIAALEGRLGEVHQTQRRQVQDSVQAKFDAMFDSLGAKDLYGEGRGFQLKSKDPNAPELERRYAAIRYAARLTGVDKPTDEQVLAKLSAAHQALYGKVSRSTETPLQEIPEDEAWLGAGLPVPTQRGGAPEPQGREKAIRALKELRQAEAAEANHRVTADDFPSR